MLVSTSESNNQLPGKTHPSMTCYMSLTHSTVGSISQMDTFFAGFLGRLVTVALSAPYKYSYLLTYLLTYV